MAMQKFYVGVKGIVRDERGLLLLEYQNGSWDVPGGRIDESESAEDAVVREITEELVGSTVLSVGDQRGIFFLPGKKLEDDCSLLLAYYLVEATLPDEIVLSSEHKSYRWIRNPEELHITGLYPEIAEILRKTI